MSAVGKVCGCPCWLVNSVICTDGTVLELELDGTRHAAATAAAHARLAARHGGAAAFSIGCPQCGQVAYAEALEPHGP